MTVSIVINNFNYSEYLAQAIESALAQDYRTVEVIVVDDGSTDDSLLIAKRYKERVKVIAKDNGGQASALNVGFAESTGSWVLFLDADDWLDPSAISTVAQFFSEAPGKIHFILQEFQQREGAFRNLVPNAPLSHGDAAAETIRRGNYTWPPTSGNIFPRDKMNRYFPIPEAAFRLCADSYLCLHAAFSGPVVAIGKVLGYYRIHENNNYNAFRMEHNHIYRKGYHLLMVRQLAMELTAERVGHPESIPIKEGSVIETIILAVRFGGLGLGQFGVRVQDLRRWWWSLKRLGGPGAGVPVWLILNWGPAFLVSWVMKLRILKARHHNSARIAQSSWSSHCIH